MHHALPLMLVHIMPAAVPYQGVVDQLQRDNSQLEEENIRLKLEMVRGRGGGLGGSRGGAPCAYVCLQTMPRAHIWHLLTASAICHKPAPA